MTKEDYIAVQIKMERFDELERQLNQINEAIDTLYSTRFNRAFLTVESDIGDHDYFNFPPEMLNDLKSILNTHRVRITKEMEEL